MVLGPGLEGCVSTKFFERLDLFPWDYSTIHVISEIITQADLKIKNWYFSSSSLFGIWDIYSPKPPKKTGQYPSQKKTCTHTLHWMLGPYLFIDGSLLLFSVVSGDKLLYVTRYS